MSQLSDRLLCRLSELNDLGARAFAVGDRDWPVRVFVVRQGTDVFGYVNRCPHAGHPLNLRPDEFLSSDRTAIQCRSHGACFEITSGLCIDGPCVGRSLTRIELRIDDDRVMLVEDPEELARRYA